MKVVSINLIDDNTVKIISKEGTGKLTSTLITDLEGDKASLAILKEIKGLTKILNKGVLKALDKSDKMLDLKKKSLKSKMKANRKEKLEEYKKNLGSKKKKIKETKEVPAKNKKVAKKKSSTETKKTK